METAEADSAAAPSKPAMMRYVIIAVALVLASGTALGQDDRDQYCRLVRPDGSRPEAKIHLCLQLGDSFAEQCLHALTDQLVDRYCAGGIGLPEIKAQFHLQ